MRNLIILLVLFLTSCTAYIGDVRQQTLVITNAKKHKISENKTEYTAKSYYKDGFYAIIRFFDRTGKYTVGDTVIIIKKQQL